MNSWILDKDPKEIYRELEWKNLNSDNPMPVTIKDYYQAILNHAHEVDIDEALADFVGGAPQMDGWLKEYTKAYKLFSKFLQEK